MKIAMISDALTTGGAERQLLLSAVELEKLGHIVKVVIYSPFIEYEDLVRQNNIDVVQIKPKGFLRMGRIRALAKYFRQEGFDVVHSFKGTASIFGSLAAKLAGIKLIFGGFRVEYRQGKIYRLAHKFVDRLLTGWVVNSKVVADSMKTMLGIEQQKFFVVYNGIHPEAFKSQLSKNEAKSKLGLSENQPVVAKFGRLHYQKNYQMFIKTASILLQRRPDIRFLIAGNGPLRQELQNYAKSIGISDQVIFLGIRSDIPDLLAAIDVSVLASDFEGFPNALIEAMCVGIPVVSTDYPGVEELIADGEHGFIVPRNDADAMAAKVAQLLDDPDLRKRMGQKGMQMIQERLSPAAMAQNLVSVYKQGMNNQN